MASTTSKSEDETVIKSGVVYRPIRPNYYTAEPTEDYNPMEIRDPRTKAIIWWLTVSFLTYIAFVGVYAYVYSKYTHAKPLKFQVNSLSVSSFNVSVSSLHVNAKWDITFMTENPNKYVKINCTDSIVSVNYKAAQISNHTIFLPFVEGGDKISVSAPFRIEETFQNSTFVEAMAKDWKHGVVVFDLKVETLIKYRADWVPLGKKEETIHVICPGLKLAFSSSSPEGKLISGWKKCSFFDIE